MLIGLFIYGLYVAIMGFFGVVWCLLACFVPVRSTPRHFVFVVLLCGLLLEFDHGREDQLLMHAWPA
jgi:hypothetical protein